MEGSKAHVVVPTVPTLVGCTPRSWNLSSDGTLIVVGFEDGALQVRMASKTNQRLALSSIQNAMRLTAVSEQITRRQLYVITTTGNLPLKILIASDLMVNLHQCM